MFIKPNFYADAISNLLPEGAGFSMAGAMDWNQEVINGVVTQTTPKNVQLFDQQYSLPHKAEIDAEVVRLQEKWEATEYQRYRKLEYPSLDILADALYWQQQGDGSKMQDYLNMVQAVKDKYPKG